MRRAQEPFTGSAEPVLGTAGTAAVLFADICDSVRLYESRGDAAAMRIVVGCIQELCALVEGNGGRVVKRQGDGILAIFNEPLHALGAAVHMQTASPGGEVSISVGIHFGTVAHLDGDVYGDTVNLAARVRDLAKAGETLFTDAMYQMLPASVRETVDPFEPMAVKGKRAPVMIYSLRQLGTNTRTFVRAAPRPAAARSANVLALRLGRAEWVMGPGLERLTVGRGGSNDLVVAAPATSREHAVIELRNGRPVLVDRSTNGTWVMAEGEAEQVLRREAAPLVGRGRIGCGASAEEIDPDQVIHYGPA
ncbi:MAG TPA: adenylate/guanylate cyclase domain-containing protein [Azospirillaceae bacterium]|nr:adenylate/guanylate cyclase domain-containing protein [Azospirillaceae bacterium]